MRKDKLIDMDVVQETIQERDIMTDTNHPFLVGVNYVFESEWRIYFIMPYIEGGDLYSKLREEKRLKENKIRFYAY